MTSPCLRSWKSLRDRKSTRLNSSHEWISYAVFCLKNKKNRGSRREPPGCTSKMSKLRKKSAATWAARSSSRQVSSSERLPLLFFFNDTSITEIYTLSLHDALPI